MNEIWKNIKNYDNYQVSNLGNVKNINYHREHRTENLKLIPSKSGYLRTALCKDGKSKMFLVHRLVAEAFIPNPDNLSCINHKDENKLNNTVENLEWCTYTYNLNYGERNSRASLSNINNPKRSIKIICTDNGVVYPSLSEAERLTGISVGSISKCCRGKSKHAGGLTWKYYR